MEKNEIALEILLAIIALEKPPSGPANPYLADNEQRISPKKVAEAYNTILVQLQLPDSNQAEPE